MAWAYCKNEKEVTGRQNRKRGGRGENPFDKVDGLCWITPEENGHKNMENKTFEQNKMGTC